MKRRVRSLEKRSKERTEVFVCEVTGERIALPEGAFWELLVAGWERGAGYREEGYRSPGFAEERLKDYAGLTLTDVETGQSFTV